MDKRISGIWTQKHDKKSFSYGNHRGHSMEEWRMFMRQCYVLGVVKYDLRSMIKDSGVMGIIYIILQKKVKLTLIMDKT